VRRRTNFLLQHRNKRVVELLLNFRPIKMNMLVRLVEIFLSVKIEVVVLLPRRNYPLLQT
jgi:hypothetical protein